MGKIYRHKSSNTGLTLTVFALLIAGGWLINYKFHIADRVLAQFQNPYKHGVNEMQSARFDEAEESFQRAVLTDPNHAENVYSLGWALQAQGKDTEALKHYKNAEALALRGKMNSILERIYTNSGAIYLKQHNYPAAETAFRAALRMNARSVDSNYQLAMSMKAQRKVKEARQYFEYTLKLDPSYLAARYQIDHLVDDTKPVTKKKARKLASVKKRK
jgi:tetratricopeptide (TPR) repeat protein